MKRILSALGLAAVFVFAAAPVRAELTLTLKDGRVTLVADNVTPRQILAEWARVGQVRLINGDKVPGSPVTLRLIDVPEKQALDIILKGAAGYMAAPRADLVAQGSVYDRILVLPTSTVVASAGNLAPLARPAPMVSAPQPYEAPQAEAEETDEAPPQPAGPAFNPYVSPGRPPQMNYDPAAQQGGQAPATFPGSVVMPQVQPGEQAEPQAVPNSPTGAARPGQIVPAPTQPVTYANPYNIGAPSGTASGSDPSKYTNPYQPTPGRPIKPPSD